ncbi:MAG: ZIP family metal transporter [Euryarchaeota archaeon]|nr:ZIP family metal transporter [Euryarchaeota archaeon]
MESDPIVYALVTFVIAMTCGLLPVYSKMKQNPNMLKMATAVASGIIIASAMLVVIPEGYELATGDPHSEDDSLARDTALVLLSVEKNELNASQGIISIEGLLGVVHGDENHDEEGHDEETSTEGLAGKIEHVIEEVELAEITAEEGIEEISTIVTTQASESGDGQPSELMIGGALVSGFILMLILEGSGIGHAVHEEHHDHSDDHGHDHVHHGKGWALVFGLTLHAATDGLAVGAALATGSLHFALAVVLAVIIHKGPAAFSLGVFSMHERGEKKDTIRDITIFSAATPVMIFVAYYAFAGVASYTIGLTMLFAAGTFLYVATVDTLPDMHNPETSKKSMQYVILGVIIMFVLLIISDLMGLGHAH